LILGHQQQDLISRIGSNISRNNMWRKKQIENIKQQGLPATAAAADTSSHTVTSNKPTLLSKIQIQEIIQNQISTPLPKHSVAEGEITGKGDDCSISSCSSGNTNYCLYFHTDINVPDINNLLYFEIRLSTQIITPVQKLQMESPKVRSSERSDEDDDMDDETLPNVSFDTSPNFTHYKFGVTVPLEFPSTPMHLSLISIRGQGVADGGVVTASPIISTATAAGAFTSVTNQTPSSLHHTVVLQQLQSQNTLPNTALTSLTDVVKFLKRIVFESEKKTFEAQQVDALSMLVGNEDDTIQQLEKQYFIPEYDETVVEESIIDRRHNYVLRTCSLRDQTFAVRTVIFSKPEQLEPLKREAMLLCTLKHPSIVEHIGYGLRKEKFQFKIIMEHCKYGFLYDILFKPPAKKKAQEVNELRERLKDKATIYRVAISAAKALHYLHTEKKMVYVNLNTSNIMLSDDFQTKFLVDSSTCYVCNIAASGPTCCNSSDLENRELLVIPPTIIKYYNTNVSSAETAVLVQYKAPEQILLSSGKYILSSAVDIFAFGIFLYEIFTQRNPWKGTQPKIIMEKVANGERPELSTSFILVPEQKEIEEIIRACWNQEPTQRPSISQVISALINLSRC